MYSVLVILAVLVAILLTFIVVIQESKGGGLASNFAASNQIMGVRKLPTLSKGHLDSCRPVGSNLSSNHLLCTASV